METINFSPASLWILNGTLAFVMFGVAMELTLNDFRALARKPWKIIAGLISQFLLMPALTFGLVSVLKPEPELALGMFMVAACPGGNMSNFLSLLSGGNAALSVSMTGFASFLSILFTPLNFAFWAGLHGPTAELLREIHLDAMGIALTVAVVIAVPLVAGMLVRSKRPKFAHKAGKTFRILSIVLFGGFVAIAFASNFDLFLKMIGTLFGVVFLHNALALATGYGWGKLLRFPEADARSFAIETGIQNSGLGLALIFTFFDGRAGMALIAAWWGVWHLISGLGLAAFWSRRKPDPAKSQ